MNLINLFEKSAEENSNALAIRYPSGEITYGVLMDAVRRLAGGLQRKGICRDSRVALMLPNVPHYVISYLAILRSGATVIPINHGLSEYELTPMLEEGEVDSIICWSGDLKVIYSVTAKLPLIKNLIVLGERLPVNVNSLTRLISVSQPLFEPTELDDDDIAVIRFGNGRSGRPVGAEFTHYTTAANAIAVRDTLEITPQDRIAAVMPLTHPAGEGLILNLFIASGCSLSMSTRFEPISFSKELRSDGTTILTVFPSMLRSLVNCDNDLTISPTLRLTLCTGGYLDEELLKDFERRFGGYTLECYTLPDTGPVVATNKWRTGRRVGSLGHPLSGVEMRVIGDSGKECSIGEVGEIVVRGSGVMRSYVGRPRYTGLKLADRWIRTEEDGKMDINGFFYYSGCDPDRMVLDGKSFYTCQIEHLLSIHPNIAESVVVVIIDENNELRLKACIVPVIDSQLTAENILQYFRLHLSYYKCPELIRFYNDLPRDSKGEIDRELLAGLSKDI